MPIVGRGRRGAAAPSAPTYPMPSPAAAPHKLASPFEGCSSLVSIDGTPPAATLPSTSLSPTPLHFPSLSAAQPPSSPFELPTLP